MITDDPALRSCVEWQKTGSLLLSTSEEEAEQLLMRQEQLHQHHVHSRFLSVEEVRQLVPSLSETMHRGALLTEEDAQIVSGCEEHMTS
jgi:L-2-hydroxyglutarate oxidase LhgO